MPRLSCTEALFRLKAIRSEMESLRDEILLYTKTGDKSLELGIENKGLGIEKMVKELRKSLELPEGHFRLENIPNWKELPDIEALKKDFKFDWIWEQEYRPKRSLSDFEIQSTVEAEPIAKVFEIGDLIQKKKQQDPNHPDYLETAEVLEEIDKAGYRSATLQELLAFGRDYWDPEKTPYVYTLNSVFSDADGHRRVPCLRWGGDRRRLSADGFGNGWGAGDRFLVLRKASSE